MPYIRYSIDTKGKS